MCVACVCLSVCLCVCLSGITEYVLDSSSSPPFVLAVVIRQTISVVVSVDILTTHPLLPSVTRFPGDGGGKNMLLW